MDLTEPLVMLKNNLPTFYRKHKQDTKPSYFVYNSIYLNRYEHILN